MNKSLVYYLLAFVLFYGIFRGVKYLYYKPSGSVGSQVEDFTATLKSGETFNLSDLKGKYVLLQFWGSWCGPCRRGNRELITLYPVFNKVSFKSAKGFEIVSIGVETDRSRWENAILQDNMTWPYHTSDFKGFESDLAKRHGIKSIPATYMLDPTGRILGINWTVEQMRAFLAQEINNN